MPLGQQPESPGAVVPMGLGWVEEVGGYGGGGTPIGIGFIMGGGRKVYLWGVWNRVCHLIRSPDIGVKASIPYIDPLVCLLQLTNVTVGDGTRVPPVLVFVRPAARDMGVSFDNS